ncbi:hypothetical protein [Mesorhizobium delmotii]|uniref:hypothetical protein n=1 Tax=Mesorhizobium delmotii TaxID=1631247 RepID=UPI001402E84C|nr:hypothetical protein [Mesorhizobium delmotii]
MSTAIALIFKNGGGLEQRRDFRVECHRHQATDDLPSAELQDALQFPVVDLDIYLLARRAWGRWALSSAAQPANSASARL